MTMTDDHDVRRRLQLQERLWVDRGRQRPDILLAILDGYVISNRGTGGPLTMRRGEGGGATLHRKRNVG